MAHNHAAPRHLQTEQQRLTTTGDVRRWAHNQQQRIEQRLLQASTTMPEHQRLQGALLMIRKLIKVLP